jgi:hypothetical protein
MAPIHLHFELLGWSETQIVQRFWLIGLDGRVDRNWIVAGLVMTNWNGTRTLILGAARQGLALARWLDRHGSHVTVSDSRSCGRIGLRPSLSRGYECRGRWAGIRWNCWTVRMCFVSPAAFR